MYSPRLNILPPKLLPKHSNVTKVREAIVGEIQLNRAVDQYISSRSAKDRKGELVLRMRFGIGVAEVLTLEEIGMRLDVTRERIRQIEAKALTKLRHPSRSEPFTRMVLGMGADESPLAAGARQPECDDGPDAEEAVPSPAAPKQPASARPPHAPTQPVGSSKPTALDRVLAQATALGVPVEDGRETTSGRIWVTLVATAD